MALPEIIFWVVFMVVAFIGLLGIQLRYFGGVALKLAIGNRVKEASRQDVAAIIAHAVGGGRLPSLGQDAHRKEVEHAREAFAATLRQMRIGRQITLIVPFTLALMLVAFRFVPGLV